jgi:glycosyltransferase involved in cell wall biosynthesis
VNAVVEALRSYLSDPAKRTSTGKTGRSLVETYYNWDRVARDTRNFTYEVVKRDAGRGKRDGERGKGEGL